MQKITPHLWFDKDAEEAARFYVEVFSSRGGSASHSSPSDARPSESRSGGKNSKIGKVSLYGKEGFEIHHMPEGAVMTVEFELEGQKFLALNGGPIFKFNEAISFVVHCDTQAEIDYFWEKLSAVKASEQCGWLKDKYGLSWQIVPSVLPKMLGNKDPAKAGRVMQAMLQMKKLDMKKLEKAYDQG